MTHNGPLLADLSQVCMAYSLWKQGMQNYQAAFHIYYRKALFKGGFAVFAGLDQILEILNNFKFTEEDVEFLRTLKNLDETPTFEEDFQLSFRDDGRCRGLYGRKRAKSFFQICQLSELREILS